jgi:RNA polymerase sigma-70 factor (ECF subfamily)
MPPADRFDESQLEIDRLLETGLGPLHTHVRLSLGPFLRTRESVSDVVQSAMREVWKQRDRLAFESEGAFRAYMFQVATRKILEKHRYHEAQCRAANREVPGEPPSQLPGSAGCPKEGVERAEDLELLQSAFDELDESDRTILSICKVLDVPVTEAARELGIAESTARYRLGSAMARLVAGMARRGLRPD